MKPAAKVKAFRKRADFTQVEAAEWYGCTERAWQRYEAGDRRVPTPLLKEIDRWEGLEHMLPLAAKR